MAGGDHRCAPLGLWREPRQEHRSQRDAPLTAALQKRYQAGSSPVVRRLVCTCRNRGLAYAGVCQQADGQFGTNLDSTDPRREHRGRPGDPSEVLGDSQECHHDHDPDHGDSRRLFAHISWLSMSALTLSACSCRLKSPRLIPIGSPTGQSHGRSVQQSHDFLDARGQRPGPPAGHRSTCRLAAHDDDQFETEPTHRA